MARRTFKVAAPNMHGPDVKLWQHQVKKLFKDMRINCPIAEDGFYGVATRSFTSDLVHASGMSSGVQMKSGVTPELREKLVKGKLSPAQKAIKHSPARKAYRQKLRSRYEKVGVVQVHSPTSVIITDSWGFHSGVHDGVDLITPRDAVIFAMIKSEVVDVRSSGWWGLGAPHDPRLKAKGDGIIQLKVLESVGPFRKGMHIGYGHAEKAQVHEGQVVRAGAPIGHAGLANAWHVHLMANDGRTDKGVGTFDPRPLIDYARRHSYS